MAGTVNAAAAARLAGISERTMRAWLAAGKITGEKVQRPGQPAAWEIDPAQLPPRVTPAREAGEVAALVERVAALEQLVAKLYDRLEKQTMSKAILSDGPAAFPVPRERRDAGERVPADWASLPVPAPVLTARVPRHTVPLRWQGGGLPEGLVNWCTFAELHHIPERTVRFMIDKGRLTLVEGKWKRDNYYIRWALDATGRRQFYELWSGREDFHPCLDCPHDHD